MTKVEKEILNTIKDNKLTMAEAKETLENIEYYINILSEHITVDALWKELEKH